MRCSPILHCRAAVDHQIALERATRTRIDTLKQQELEQERQQLQQWQQQQEQQQQSQQAGDESDYEEDDLGIDGVLSGTAATAAAAGYGILQDTAAVMPDHPDYHGKGWRLSRSQAAAPAAAAATDAMEGAALDKGNGSTANSSGHAKADPEMLTVVCRSNHPISAMDRLASDTSAALAQNTCSLIGASSNTTAAAEDADSSEQLLTVVQSSRSHSNKNGSYEAMTAADSKSVQPKQPAVVPARSRSKPVAVTFTQLQTPHLPAREQREVEFKQIKRSAQVGLVATS